MANLAGPSWLTCLGDLSYEADVEDMDDESLLYESYRVEVENPSTNHAFNDRDWRYYRRLIRHEMHRRRLTTPLRKPESPF